MRTRNRLNGSLNVRTVSPRVLVANPPHTVDKLGVTLAVSHSGIQAIVMTLTYGIRRI